jgi:hypothetical protein
MGMRVDRWRWLTAVAGAGRKRRSRGREASGRPVVAMFACSTALVCMPAPASAMSGGNNAGATAAYLRAAEVFARAQAANLGASVAAMEKQVSGIASGCPSVLAGAPKGAQLSAVSGEIASAALFSSIAPDRTAILAFAGKVAALHWSDAGVAKLVREVVAEERATAKLALPDVCTDLSAWKTSGYHTLPSSTMGQTCSGKLTLHVRHLVREKDGKKIPRVTTIASATFSIDAGTRFAASVHLNNMGRRLLNAGHGRLAANLQLERELEPTQTANVHILEGGGKKNASCDSRAS